MERLTAGIIVHSQLREKLFHPDDLRRMAHYVNLLATDSPTPIDEDAAIAILQDADIAISGWGTPVLTQRVAERCPRLRLWLHSAGSVKHMFGPHLADRQITIASCKPALAENVAEFTLACIIMGVRGAVLDARANRRNEHYVNDACLYRRTVGIIGASLIGTLVMRLLMPFRCRMLLYDPYLSRDEAKALGAEATDLLTLCRQSDVISLHTPNVPDTQRLLCAEHFQAMRDDAVFINTARGACIDEIDLIAELARGRLFAFLDVTNPEPTPADSPLRSLPNVFLTSHIGGARAFNQGAQIADDIERFMHGGEPLCVTRPGDLDRIA